MFLCNSAGPYLSSIRKICKFSLTLQRSYAEVVELVDTLCSGRSARKGMRVRISPPAHFFI